MNESVPQELASHWSVLKNASMKNVSGGLINRTIRVTSGADSFILQELNPIFHEDVHWDIDAITRHLESKGILTPRLVPTDSGQLWAKANHNVWRMQSAVAGDTLHRIAAPETARAAGRHVAIFHNALSDLVHEYRFARGHVHDTAQHLQNLAAALATHPSHRLWAEVKELAESLLEDAKAIPRFDHLETRHCHGDLKISNFIFQRPNQVACLVDLDTLSLMKWPLEMGDALRSWCNPCAEDDPEAHFDLQLLEAALSGYATPTPSACTAAEKQTLFAGVQTICLELSARFLADALSESYFGWDDAKYTTRGDHNFARGKAMFHLYEDVTRKQSQTQDIIRGVLK
jgi:Ser/Thr protein kinase RdoA (MazF antagonist)